MDEESFSSSDESDKPDDDYNLKNMRNIFSEKSTINKNKF